MQQQPKVRGREGKRQAIWEAARTLFLRDGYDRISMDQVAAIARVSKQTVYLHFSTKEHLFVDVVTQMTSGASDEVHGDIVLPTTAGEMKGFLTTYAERQLKRVLHPDLMRLRRLVIGEVGRFPELAAALRKNGPQRAIQALSLLIARLAELGALAVDDNHLAAEEFNWLVMAAPLNDVMMLGEAAVPSGDAMRRHAERAVAIFIKAYAK